MPPIDETIDAKFDLDTLVIRLPSVKEEDKHRRALLEIKEWLNKF